MAQELLLEKLEGLASKAKLIEREKAEAVAKIQELEREAQELKELISVAESKADEMLSEGVVPDMPKRPVTPEAQVTSAPLASKGFEQLAEPTRSQQDEMKRRFPNAFKSDWR